MVFQSYAVFPHLKVCENIAFGLQMQKETRRTIKQRVDSVAELLQSRTCSTAIRRRSPAASASASPSRARSRWSADVLLMDEPLSNLDALLRMQLRAELKALLHDLGTTTIYVTHDQIEALSMGDRIAVMNGGGSPRSTRRSSSTTTRPTSSSAASSARRR